MKEIILIIKKELTELFRDKKTIINSIILPVLITPILIVVVSKVMEFVNKKDAAKTIKIGLMNAPADFNQLVANDTLNKVTTFTEAADFKTLINDGTVQTVLVFPENWKTDMDSLRTGEIQIYRNEAKRNVNTRVGRIVTNYTEGIKNARIASLQIPMEKLTPVKRSYVEVGEKKEAIGKAIGGFIPYIFILGMWGGCLLAAIDLVTGEKERKTVETTLSLPLSKFNVLIGKAIVAAILGLLPAVFNIIGLVVGLQFIDLPPAFDSFISELVTFESLSLILLLLVPFSIFLSGLLIAIIAGATTFKEAQSKATPVIMFIILPLVMALLPGIELTWATVFVPVLNIGLAVKEITAGTMDMLQYVVILISLLLFSVGAIYLSYRKFSDENAILK
ncbi:ABC transporter permease [Spongiivirga citrea]|uniref:ABC transporter permease n=1 Tax=Spongiivirga citrea TaxID=1481457 RepID=A0A6M0CRH5_9FLAO|nr:ABC transporter permease [Spongiivirga citrea]NER18117.1 ABC transporter permease [Spongiivirga citrea]